MARSLLADGNRQRKRSVDFTYRLGHFFFRSLARGLYDARVVGADHLKFTGGALIVCNHVSFLDPPFVGQIFDEPIHFFARKSLFEHPVAGWILRQWQTIPIDRDKPDASSLKATIRLLKAGKKVLMFPEGTRSPDGSLQKAEPGVGLFVAKSGAPVLPVYISGTYEALPRGAKCLHPAQVTITVGKLYQALADEAMEKIAELRA